MIGPTCEHLVFRKRRFPKRRWVAVVVMYYVSLYSVPRMWKQINVLNYCSMAQLRCTPEDVDANKPYPEQRGEEFTKQNKDTSYCWLRVIQETP